MIRNNFLSRFIVVTLTAALLLVSGSRAYRVSALADPVQSIAPVFDTQIYQLQDYIDHGGLGEPQLDIFYIMAGMYAVAQGGSQAIKLNDSFQTEDGIWNWFKSLGVRTYNSLINLLPDTARMPITGEVFSTIPFKNATAVYVASLMGMALEAKNFDTVEEFKQTVSTGSYYLPWNFDIQKGMNSIFGIYGGIYSWQFDSAPFETDFIWKTRSLDSAQSAYLNSFVTDLADVPYRANYNSGNYTYNYFLSLPTTYDLFFNTSTNQVYLVYGAGYQAVGWVYNRQGAYWDSDDNRPYFKYDTSVHFSHVSTANIPGTTLIEKTRYIYNHFDLILTGNYGNSTDTYFDPTSVIGHVYAGDNWLARQEIYNLTDLNFDDPDIDNDIDHYYSVPEDMNYLLDIHNLVRDILNNTDLFNIILNHIVDLNGVAVHDDQLIRITTSIYDLLKETYPVLPVDLNDISELTDNTYLDIVKERATAAGSTLASLVAFWHNCDFELVYVLFGAGITVLIGAFIGKWGHS